MHGRRPHAAFRGFGQRRRKRRCGVHLRAAGNHNALGGGLRPVAEHHYAARPGIRHGGLGRDLRAALEGRRVAGACRDRLRRRLLDSHARRRMGGVDQRKRPDHLHADGRDGRLGRRRIRVPSDDRRTGEPRLVHDGRRPEHSRRRYGGRFDELFQQQPRVVLGQR